MTRERPRLRAWTLHRLLLATIVVSFAVTATAAMRHSSTTFDEILLPAAGARGYATGSFDLVTLYHPPALTYVYGLPVAFSGVTYPAEEGVTWNTDNSFIYARALYFENGNDPQRIAFLARLVGVALGMLLIITTYLFASFAAGSGTGVLAAALIAFTPDVLAHSGVSYNDVPLALVLLVALWAADAAIRDPRPRRAVLAGGAIGLALGVKFSAVALGPAGLLLLALEAARRWPDPTWLRRTALHAAPLVLAAAYLTLVLIYRGDVTLHAFREGLLFNITHANAGHGAPAVLLGRQSVTGWWYFFPIAFFLKTSAALHILIGLAIASLWLGPRARHWREFAGSPLRAAVVGGATFLGFVMAARLNIGFRHALPILPLLCILVAAGAVRMWSMRRQALRLAIAIAVAWHVIAPFTAYPFFLSYLSEYTGPDEYSYETLVDSSLDWGQGLIALREFMAEVGAPTVLLSYFGSALPSAYGVDYVPLASFFPLPAQPHPEEAPTWVAISSTNLAGNYLPRDPFARFRDIQPYRIVGGSIFIFRFTAQ